MKKLPEEKKRVITISLSPALIEAIDQARAKDQKNQSRSDFVEQLARKILSKNQRKKEKGAIPSP